MLKDLLTKALSFLGNKFLANPISTKIHDYLKKVINSVRIPSLLSFFISKDGQIDPSVESALATAPDPKTNWDRLGLEKEAIGGLPKWTLFFMITAAICFFLWADIIKQGLYVVYSASLITASPSVALWLTKAYEIACSAVDFLARFGIVVPLAVTLNYLRKDLMK